MVKETKTIGIKLVFAWIFSVLFIVGGIGILFSSFLSGIFTFMAGLILLPPFNNFLDKKYKLKITTWLKILIVLVLLVFSGMAMSNESSDNSNQGNLASTDNSNTQDTQTTTPTQTTPQTTTPAVEEPTDTATMGERNALSSALSYLRYSAFSYSGLIDQLEYEGYSYQEAKYAVDNCGADWNEQAALSAESYLKYSAFSRQGLIDQLIYEGFTQSQAEYGVNAVGY